MICPKCKKDVKETDNYCARCGHNLSKDNLSSQTKSERKLNPVFMIFLAFISSLVIVFLILDSNKVTQNEAGNTASSEQASELMAEIESLRKSLEQDPGNAQLNVQMGNNYFDISRFEEAIKYYKRALQTEPDNANVLIDLGVAYFNINIVDSALYHINQAMVIDPVHRQGLFNLGVIYYNSARFEEAKRYWNRLIGIHANSREADMAEQLLNKIE